MRKVLQAIIVLALLTSQTLAGVVIDPYSLASGGAPPPAATISFVGCTGDATDQQNFTFTNHATGTAGTRKTIVGVAAKDSSSAFTIDSMTVGGISATEKVDTSAETAASIQSAIYMIDNPSGTTATIVVNMSEAITSMVVCVWAAYDVLSETAFDTASQRQAVSAAITLDLDVPAEGVAVGMSDVDGASATVTWVGFTENGTETAVEGGGQRHTASSGSTTTAGTPLTASADWSGSAESLGVSASFR